MKWTRFYDMNSGGYEKLEFDTIYIELPMNKAISMFQVIFGIDPENITCNCCGEDYSISEYDSIDEVTKWELEAGSSNNLTITLKDIEIHLKGGI